MKKLGQFVQNNPNYKSHRHVKTDPKVNPIINHDDAYQRVHQLLKEYAAKSPVINHIYNIVQKAELLNPFKINDKDNPKKKIKIFHRMWLEQTTINFPLLYLASLLLKKWATNDRQCNNYLFATRDCTYFHRIFKKLFAADGVSVHYFHCSRNMLERATEDSGNEEYKNYVETLINKDEIHKTVFVDIHGTSKRIFSFFEKQYKGVLPYSFLLSTHYLNYKQFDEICRKQQEQNRFITLYFNSHGSPIEMLNYDTQGTLQNYTKSGPKRDKPEYNLKKIKPYHDAMNVIIDTLLTPNTFNVDDTELQNICLILFKNIFHIIENNRPAVALLIKPVAYH